MQTNKKRLRAFILTAFLSGIAVIIIALGIPIAIKILYSSKMLARYFIYVIESF